MINIKRDLVKLVAEGGLQMCDDSSMASLVVCHRSRHSLACKRTVALLHLLHRPGQCFLVRDYFAGLAIDLPVEAFYMIAMPTKIPPTINYRVHTGRCCYLLRFISDCGSFS